MSICTQANIRQLLSRGQDTVVARIHSCQSRDQLFVFDWFILSIARRTAGWNAPSLINFMVSVDVKHHERGRRGLVDVFIHVILGKAVETERVISLAASQSL